MKQVIFVVILMMAIMISGCSSQRYQAPSTYVSPSAQDTSNPASGQVVPTANTPQATVAETKDVAISNFAFSPATITITVGSSIVWTNDDSVPHSIVADVGGINSGAISPGGTFTHTFNTPGTYNYHCGIHPSMQGTIVVQ